jgi:hypothetical protein
MGPTVLLPQIGNYYQLNKRITAVNIKATKCIHTRVMRIFLLLHAATKCGHRQGVHTFRRELLHFIQQFLSNLTVHIVKIKSVQTQLRSIHLQNMFRPIQAFFSFTIFLFFQNILSNE